MIESKSEIRVRYVETDAGGVVHHSSFIPWLEVARIDLMDNIGLPYHQLEKEWKVHMAVLEMHLKILKPAYFDDRLIIKAYIRECPKVRLTVGYEISRDVVLIATGETMHAFMSNEKKAVKPPRPFTEIMENHF